MFNIRMGIPEMEDLWRGLVEKNSAGSLTKDESKLYKKLGKALKQLSSDPRYPGLQSHEIDDLTKRYGIKVWESYLENNTPGAGRMFWVYGPDQGEITIIGLEPHPNDKSNSYKRIVLSATQNETEQPKENDS